MQTAEQCATLGGQIITWTNTAGRGTPVGECYVPPKVSGGSGSGSGWGSGFGGGDNRTAMALGAAGQFLSLFASIIETHERNRPSAAAYDYTQTQEYRDYIAEQQALTVTMNQQTDDLQSLVRRGRSPQSGISGLDATCPGAESGAAIAQCYEGIAGELEAAALDCRNDACVTAFIRAAATARCTAGYAPDSLLVTETNSYCARFPGDYQRYRDTVNAYYPWTDDPEASRYVVRDARYRIKAQFDRKTRNLNERAAVIETYLGDELVHSYETVIHEDCIDVEVAPTICDLAMRVRDADERGWTPTTPFNCGRARGIWEGDIVNGVCRLPGVDQKPYDPGLFVNQDERLMSTIISRAIEKWRAQDPKSATRLASQAEQVFATLVGLTTTMSPEARARVLSNGLVQIQRLIAVMQEG
jgi:hypothetical protein